MFVGREKELAALRESLDSVINGGIKCCFVSGKSGSGKTELSHQFRFGLDDILVGESKSSLTVSVVPFLSLCDAINNLIQDVLLFSHKLVAPFRELLLKKRRLCSVVASVFSLAPIVGNLESLPRLPPVEHVSLLLSGIHHFLKCITSLGKPIILILDDAHFLDPMTCQAVSHVFDSSDIHNLMLVCCFRPEEVVDPGHPLKEMQSSSGVSKSSVYLSLSSLSKTDCSEYAASLLPPNYNNTSELFKDLSCVLYHESGGWPLNLARIGQKTRFDEDKKQFFIGDKSLSELRVSCMDYEKATNIEDAANNFVTASLQSLSESDRKALQCLSCGSDSFSVEYVISILDWLDEDEARRIMDSAIELGFMRVCDTTTKGDQILYQFQHDSIKTAVYQSMSADSQQNLHLLIGRGIINGIFRCEIIEEMSSKCKVLDARDFRSLIDGVFQLNRGVNAVKRKSDKIWILGLNIVVSERLVKEGSWELAKAYSVSGANLLHSIKDHVGVDDIWSDQELTNLGSRLYGLYFEVLWVMNKLIPGSDIGIRDKEARARSKSLQPVLDKPGVDISTLNQMELYYYVYPRLNIQGRTVLMHARLENLISTGNYHAAFRIVSELGIDTLSLSGTDDLLNAKNMPEWVVKRSAKVAGQLLLASGTFDSLWRSEDELDEEDAIVVQTAGPLLLPACTVTNKIFYLLAILILERTMKNRVCGVYTAQCMFMIVSSWMIDDKFRNVIVQECPECADFTFDDYNDAAHRIGDFLDRQMSLFQNPHHRSMAAFVKLATFDMKYLSKNRCLSDSFPSLLEHSQKYGPNYYCATSASYFAMYTIFSGAPFSKLREIHDHWMPYLVEIHHAYGLSLFAFYSTMLDAFEGKTVDPCSFRNPQKHGALYTGSSDLWNMFSNFTVLILVLGFGRHKEFEEVVSAEALGLNPLEPVVVDSTFYSLVSFIAEMRILRDDAVALGKTVDSIPVEFVALKTRIEWIAKSNPSYYMCWYDMMCAEETWTLGDCPGAMGLFTSAGMRARQDKNLLVEAFAMEACAQICVLLGFGKDVGSFMHKAFTAYCELGWKTKIQDMLTQHPYLKYYSLPKQDFTEFPSSPRGTSNDVNTNISQDTTTSPKETAMMMQVARLPDCRSISDLAWKLLNIFVFSSHAHCGAVFLASSIEGFVLKHFHHSQAATSNTRSSWKSFYGKPIQECAPILPVEVLLQAVNEESSVIIEEVEKPPKAFHETTYASLKLHDISSIICITLNHREKLLGVVYLEMQHGDVFDCKTSVLEIAAKMASVHVENALLYEEVQETNSALRLALEQISAADLAAEAKNRFVAMISHELRTPLHGIMASNDCLKMTDLNSEQNDLVCAIHDSCALQLHLVNNILDYSRIDANMIQLEERHFSLRQCVNSAASIILPSALDKGHDIMCYVQSDCPDSIVGDYCRIQQVLVNLLSNSIKYSNDNSEITLSVKAGVKEIRSDGSVSQVVRFEVTDSGRGIAPENLTKIAQPFVMFEESKYCRVGGTGLGLSICTKIMELMNGSLTLRSDGVGKGTTAVASLTATLFNEGDKAPSESVIRGLSVVLFCPCPLIEQLLSEMLTDLGLTVLSKVRSLSDLTLLRQHSKGKSADILFLYHRNLKDIDLVQCADEYKGDSTAVVLAREKAVDNEISSHFDSIIDLPIHSLDQLEKGLTLAYKPEESRVFAVASESVCASNHDQSDAKVLVVDDNAVNRKVLVQMLRKLKYNDVKTASDGLVAVEMASCEYYNIILMDLHMPRMDGEQATFEILSRHSELYPLKPLPSIAIVTADATFDGIPGVVAVLNKPYNVGQLQTVLTKLTNFNY